MKTFRYSRLKTIALLLAGVVGCGGDGGGDDGDGAGGTPAEGGGAPGATGGTPAETGGTTGVVPTPMGTLFMEDFESGVGNWDVTQGTCSVQGEDSNVFTCVNGGNEARAVAGDIWGEYSVQARVRLNAMDDSRRVYLAGRFTDSNNWYGAAFYNSSPPRIQLRKKVDGSSADIADGTYPVELGVWYTVKLELKGSTLRMYVDDVLQIEATDTSFSSGRIALLVDRSDVSWDDVLVTNP